MSCKVVLVMVVVEKGSSCAGASPKPDTRAGSWSVMVISVVVCCAQALDAMQNATAAEMRVALKNGEWFAMTFP
nr:hypothetical protein [uncultured Limnohabitans sp.]